MRFVDWLGAIASVLAIMGAVIAVIRFVIRYFGDSEPGSYYPPASPPISRPAASRRVWLSLHGLVILVILLSMGVVALSIVAFVSTQNVDNSARQACYVTFGSDASCAASVEDPGLANVDILLAADVTLAIFAGVFGIVLAIRKRTWGWFGLLNLVFMLSCFLDVAGLPYSVLISGMCANADPYGYDNQALSQCTQEAQTYAPSYHDWITYMIVILFLIILVLATLMWIFGLVRAGRAHRWGWFTCVLFTNPIGALLYSVFGIFGSE